MTRDCKHGQQARACNVCELEMERDALLEAVREASYIIQCDITDIPDDWDEIVDGWIKKWGDK